jgi:hypothetical protein
MSDSPRDEPTDVPLNPALKSRSETTYDTNSSTPAPVDTASAKEGEGEAWPIVWLVVFILCVAVAIYYLL